MPSMSITTTGDTFPFVLKNSNLKTIDSSITATFWFSLDVVDPSSPSQIKFTTVNANYHRLLAMKKIVTRLSELLSNDPEVRRL